MDIYDSDPLIGQYEFEVKQKGNNPFRTVFQGFVNYSVKPGFVPPTDAQFVASNEIVLLGPGEFIGRSFENTWPKIVGPPSIAHPQNLQGPGRYIVRVRYVPIHTSSSNPSMSSSNPSLILDKAIVSDEVEVEVVR